MGTDSMKDLFEGLTFTVMPVLPSVNFYTPKRILKSGNRTIVFWMDGTKTIVKRAEDEQDNDYAAFTAALGIKCFGSNSALKRIVERTETQKVKQKEKSVEPLDLNESLKSAAQSWEAAAKTLAKVFGNNG